jgi:hypothetical protein
MYLAELVQVPSSTQSSVDSRTMDMNLPHTYQNLQYCNIQTQLVISLQISM